MEKFIVPEIDLGKFTCPHCNAITQHTWGQLNIRSTNEVYSIMIEGIRYSACTHCKDITLWYIKKKKVNNKYESDLEICIYPNTLSIPPINSEMPEDIKELYIEAGSIFSKSPRASAALLRLAIQKLCIHLGESGNNINDDIKNLVKKGLPEIVQKSLDIVRITGNDAVHPGQIDTDDPETVKTLFELLNIIVEYMIAMPNKISGLYHNLPQEKKDAVASRDK